VARRDQGEVVLVTGFPGLQARKLVEHLLAVEPETRVTLVVLPKLGDEAEEALARIDPGAQKRVEVLEGDAAAMDMGLSGREYRELAARVTRIHHVAHVSYVGVTNDVAEYTNVGGAVEAVELARSAERLRCLVHHSTALVSGDRTGVVYEHELDEGQGFHSVVHASRMRAELVMRRASAELPIAVVRPTMLAGDSGTGEVDRFDGPYLLVMLILGLPGDMAVPLPAGSDKPLNVVAVDFVVRAARAIGQHPDAPGRTFHLASPEELTQKQVVERIAQAGGRRTTRSFVPAHVARVLLGTPGVDRLLREPRVLLGQLATTARYDARNAARILEGTGIECPPLSSYVETWVSAVQEHLRHRRRRAEPLAADPDDPLA
jgi:thioester reductase-like protein